MDDSEDQGPPPLEDSTIETRSQSRLRRPRDNAGSRGASGASLPAGSLPTDQSVSDLTSQLASLTAHTAQQDSVLSNITSQLQDLATKFDYLQYPEDFEYEEEEPEDTDPLVMVPSSVSVDPDPDPLDRLLADLPDNIIEPPGDDLAQDDALLELNDILKAGFQPPEYGPAVSERVAASFVNFTNHTLSSESSTSLKNKIKIPENLKSVGVPRVNACIWNGLDARTRTTDTKAQFLQQWLGSALSSLARQTDLIWNLAESKKLTKEDVKPLLASLMDSAQCVGQAHREISLRRRGDLKAVRPALAPLCSSEVAITEFLFGDKLEDDLKAAQAASKLVQKPTQVFRPQRRWRPYSTRRGVPLNVRGGLRRGGHGPLRGRPGQQQQQHQARRSAQSTQSQQI